ncbi:MAG: hypothetical protein D6770_03685 [Anaerolineae bacterium]|nr:MAG: hypothetical protein D6770_03685 [Anaerolineae bacterium]
MSAKRTWSVLLILSLAFLTACGGAETPQPTPFDPVAIFTSAAQTVAVQLTETARFFTPTPPPTATETPAPVTPGTPVTPPPALGTPPTVGAFTPFASPTPLQPTVSGPLCDDFVWIADIGVQDGDVMKPGQDFKKIWRVRNTGVCTWDEGYVLKYLGGSLDGYSYKITAKKDFLAPGEVKDYGVNLTAPLKEGEYTDCWQWVNDRGVPFGPYLLCATIKVQK